MDKINGFMVEGLNEHLADNVSHLINVSDYGAHSIDEVGYETFDSTVAIQALIDAGKKITFKQGKIYLVSELSLNANSYIDGNGATLKCNTDAKKVLKCDFVSASKVTVYDLNIDLSSTPNSYGIYGNLLVKADIQNIHISDGLYGVYLQNSYNNSFNNIMIGNPTQAGMYFQGDGGAEQTLNNIYISTVSGKSTVSGIEIERTTSTDVGGYYMYNVLAVKASGGTMTHGFYFHSSSASKATIVVNCVGGGADLTTDSAIKLVNVANCRFSNSWFSTGDNTKQSVELDNVDYLQFTGCNIPYGFKLSTYISKLRSCNNVMTAGTYAFNINGSPTLDQINSIGDAYQAISSDIAKFSAGFGVSENTVYCSASSSNGAFKFVNAADPSKKKFIRVNSTGGLIILNNNFDTELFELRESGSFQLLNAAASYLIGGNVVLTGRKTGWGTMTGTATRTAFDTTTVTTQQLAERVKALIDDLRSHGMIGT